MRVAKYTDGRVMYVEASAEEEAKYREPQQSETLMPEPTPEERISELEAQNQMLTECLIEMSQIVYA